jgi:phage/plasmid-like protein (TIGR03299 family)
MANSTREIQPSSVTGTFTRGGDVMESRRPESSGVSSGFYVGDRGLPWHVTMSRRLNTPALMAEASGLLRAEEALSMAGLDFEVEKVPVGIVTGRDKSRRKVWTEIPRTYATVRSDTGAVLGVVGEQYRPLQNADAFAFADLLVDSGEAKYETAGALYGGKWVFLSMEIPDEIVVAGDPSDYRLFLVVSNGHDGKHPVEAFTTVERVVCRNTLKAGSRAAVTRWKIRHTVSMEGRVAAARSALGLSIKTAEAFTAQANALVMQRVVESQVEDILRAAFPVSDRDDTPARIDTTTFGKVRDLYFTSPTVEPIRGTAYGVLNAVTEYLDHFATYRGRVAGKDDVKADSLLWGGPAEKAKERTVRLLEAASR